METCPPVACRLERGNVCPVPLQLRHSPGSWEASWRWRSEQPGLFPLSFHCPLPSPLYPTPDPRLHVFICTFLLKCPSSHLHYQILPVSHWAKSKGSFPFFFSVWNACALAVTLHRGRADLLYIIVVLVPVPPSKHQGPSSLHTFLSPPPKLGGRPGSLF